MRRQLAELGSAVRRLDQAGLDNARAELLLSRKRAELEDLMKRGHSDAVRSAEMVRPQRG
nr:hypothetical protein [Bradyrhizobium sp. JYMT SZCCT0180]